MRLVSAAILSAGLVTCSQTVRLDESARDVEFVNHEYSGKHGHKCQELGSITVESIPAEVSSDKKLSVLDIKLKNEARKLGATHVLRWPSRDWACNKDGKENSESQRRCATMDGTAYSCLIGRGT